jgi:Secreted Novel AID/APOBEC-like Deaminase 4
MPANRAEVKAQLAKITRLEQVFAIVKINGKTHRTYWSESGGNEYAHKHAEYGILDDLQNYGVEDGEIVALDITLKWSPCGQCAMRLNDLKQTLSARKATARVSIEVYYLAVYRGQSDLDPWTVLNHANIPCRAYKNQAEGAWWPQEWHYYQGYY